jgi:excisionase family DNA binding protein
MRKRQSEDQQSLQPIVQPLLLSIPEVARILSIGRTKVYDLIKREGLPVVRLGDATRVSVASLQRWIEQREQAS